MSIQPSKATLVINQLLELNPQSADSQGDILGKAEKILGDSFQAYKSFIAQDLGTVDPSMRSAYEVDCMREVVIDLLCKSQAGEDSDSEIQPMLDRAKGFLDGEAFDSEQDLEDLYNVEEKLSLNKTGWERLTGTVNSAQPRVEQQPSESAFTRAETSGGGNKCAIHAAWGSNANGTYTYDNPDEKLSEGCRFLSAHFGTLSAHAQPSILKDPIIQTFRTVLASKVRAVTKNQAHHLTYMPAPLKSAIDAHVQKEAALDASFQARLATIDASSTCKAFLVDLYDGDDSVTPERIITKVRAEKIDQLELMLSDIRFQALSQDDQDLLSDFVSIKKEYLHEQSLMPLMTEVLKQDQPTASSLFEQVLQQDHYPLESRELGLLWMIDQMQNLDLPDLVIFKEDTNQLETHSYHGRNVANFEEARQNNCVVVHHSGRGGFHYSRMVPSAVEGSA